jgi:sulfur relay (sulfurtransferase) DsrF/TusC family protein
MNFIKRVIRYIKHRLGPNGPKGFIKTKMRIFANKFKSVDSVADPRTVTQDFSEDAGVYYIAFGDKYVEESAFSARSVKEHCGLKTAICCDAITDEQREAFDIVTLIDADHARVKVDYLEKTPFERTLYLDSDTLVLEDISEMFKILDKYDVAMTHDFARKRHKWSGLIPEYKDVPDGFSEFGGGLVLYHVTRAQEFMELWKFYFYKNFKKTNGWDQASLRIASWKTKNLIYVLPPEFNVRSASNREKSDKTVELEGGLHPLRPRIYHWHGLNDPDSDIEPYKI